MAKEKLTAFETETKKHSKLLGGLKPAGPRAVVNSVARLETAGAEAVRAETLTFGSYATAMVGSLEITTTSTNIEPPLNESQLAGLQGKIEIFAKLADLHSPLPTEQAPVQTDPAAITTGGSKH